MMEIDRQSLFMSEIQCVPPIVRESLLSDRNLIAEFGIKTEEALTVNSAIASFKGIELFDAVKKASSKVGNKISIKSKDGTDCVVSVRITKDVPAAFLSYPNGVSRISPLLLLSLNKRLRVAFFSHESHRVNLPPHVTSNWRKIIISRPLTHEEILVAVANFSNTPTAVSEVISDHLARSQISLATLVPRSIEYYEQLVGKYSEQASIAEYARDVLGKHFENLSAWDTVGGTKLALLCGAHPLAAETLVSRKSISDSLKELLDWGGSVDVLSQTALIEMGLQALNETPSIEDLLKKLIAIYCSPSSQKHKHSPYRVLSIAFRAVYGELGKANILENRPSFWKRMAAFAQASLISRAILSCKSDISGLLEWLDEARSSEYIAQSYVDLRSEPRWIAEFALENQLRNELCGRVLSAGLANEETIRAHGIYEIIFSDSSDNELKKINLLMSKAAGPLEGNIFPAEKMPDDVLKKVQDDLSVSLPDAISFTMLSNCCFVFELPTELASIAASALRRAQYRIDTKGQQSLLNNCLAGLALVAATTRNVILADAIFIVIRNYIHSFPDELDLDSAFRAGMIACASAHDFSEWSNRVGNLISMIGFESIDRSEAASLFRLVFLLCEIQPELWSSCGQGLAAVEAAANA